MTKKKIIILVVITAGILLVGLQVEYMLRCNKVRKKRAEVVKTYVVVGGLAEGFRRMSKIENERPISTERIIRWINDSEFGDIIRVDHEAKQILDAWDMPITVVYEGKDTYKFVSFGPNKLDENGKSDDLVRVFDVSGDDIELVEENKKQTSEMNRLDPGSSPG